MKLKLYLAKLALVSLLLVGCATSPGESEQDVLSESSDIEPTVVSYGNFNDPLIRMNRVIFDANDLVYRNALIPASRVYINLVPDSARNRVTDFFANLKTPIYLVNNLLQGSPERSVRNLLRFSINSTLGIAGLFDQADRWFDLAPAPTNFNETLSSWNQGYGMYLVLPLAGPSDIRSGVWRVGDYFLNPVVYLTENPDRLVIQGVEAYNSFAPQALGYQELYEESDDPYLFFRNLYLQGVIRDAEYRNEPDEAQ